MLRSALLFICFCSIVNVSSGQLFKRLADRVQDKIERKIEDKVVEEVSEEIANRAMRPINDAIDAMFKKQYKETYGKDYDDSQYEGDPEGRAAAIQGMMAAMYGNVDIPDSYSFDHTISIEVYDYGSKKPNNMTLMVSSEGTSMGFKSNDQENQFIVFDFSKDQVAIFDEDKKTVMAMSGVFSMAAAFAEGAMDEQREDFKFEKMNKTKKILGYQAQGYKAETKEEKNEFYMSEDLPFDWNDSFGKMAEKLSSKFYAKDSNQSPPKGMLLEAKSKRKKDKKESKWLVKDISSKGVTIQTGDYKSAFAQN